MLYITWTMHVMDFLESLKPTVPLYMGVFSILLTLYGFGSSMCLCYYSTNTTDSPMSGFQFFWRQLFYITSAFNNALLQAFGSFSEWNSINIIMQNNTYYAAAVIIMILVTAISYVLTLNQFKENLHHPTAILYKIVLVITNIIPFIMLVSLFIYIYPLVTLKF